MRLEEPFLAPREHPGEPWEQGDAHVGVRNPIISCWGRVLEFILRFFRVPRAEIQFFFRAVSRILFVQNFAMKSGRSGVSKAGLRKERVTKNDLL